MESSKKSTASVPLPRGLLVPASFIGAATVLMLAFLIWTAFPWLGASSVPVLPEPEPSLGMEGSSGTNRGAEYLVFMEKQGDKSPEALLGYSAAFEYVADSALPGVAVIRILGEKNTIIASLEEREFVRMVVPYDPEYACH